MILSQNQHKLSVASFSGIKQVDPSFDNVLQEVHGCTDRPTGIVKRMFGKCLNSTTESGPIWSIAQLRFSDRIVNVRRNTSLFQVEPDYDQLPPFVPLDPLAPPVNPATPITPLPPAPWNPPDWPQDGLKKPQRTFPAPVPRPPMNPRILLPWDVKIRCVPPVMTINCTSEPAGESGVLEKYVDNSWGAGFWSVKVTWPNPSPWLSVNVGGHGVANGEIISTLWLDGPTMNDAMASLDMTISGAPDTSTATPVTFTLMAYMGLGTYEPLKNPQGGDISATCLVNTYKNIYTGTVSFKMQYKKTYGPSGIIYPPTVDNHLWVVGMGGFDGVHDRVWATPLTFYGLGGLVGIRRADNIWESWQNTQGQAGAPALDYGTVTLDSNGAPSGGPFPIRSHYVSSLPSYEFTETWQLIAFGPNVV